MAFFFRSQGKTDIVPVTALDLIRLLAHFTDIIHHSLVQILVQITVIIVFLEQSEVSLGAVPYCISDG